MCVQIRTNTFYQNTTLMRQLRSLSDRLPVLLTLWLPLLLLMTSCSKYDQYGNTRFIWIIIVVLDILAMIDVFRQGWDIGKKILWLAIIYLLPFLGLIAYYLFSGRNKAS